MMTTVHFSSALPGRSRGSWWNPTSFVFLLALVMVPAAFANAVRSGAAVKGVSAIGGGRSEALNPVDAQLRCQFPSIAYDSPESIEAAEEFVEGRSVSGMRAREVAQGAPFVFAPPATSGAAPAALRVFYPVSYDGAFVAELGEQRVALRAVGARFAAAAISRGRIFYTNPHESVDAIEIPGVGRSEELLLLRDARAPHVFEYDVVEMRGVGGMSLVGGAIRFASDRVDIPTVSQVTGLRPATRPHASLQIDRPWVIDANGKRSESAARWTIVEVAGHTPRIRLTIGSEPLAYPIVVDPSFNSTGSMVSARYGHTATLLPNGKVLMAGGNDGSGSLLTAELYDPSTGTFSATASMNAARSNHTATLLPNGKVLVAGGQGASFTAINSAELYDPAAGTFTVTGNMTAIRAGQTATLLSSGKVLLAGGAAGVGFLSTAELYDPAGGTNGAFTSTGSMAGGRENHTATLLPNGKVLVTGGYNGSAIVNAAELYDPTAGTNGTFSLTGSMTVARSSHTATLLPNGTVFIAGGSGISGVLASTEVYDPGATTFAGSGNLPQACRTHSATLMPSGNVLLAGGDSGGGILSSATLYNPVAHGTVLSASMASARFSHTATLLPNGKVLLAGGQNPPGTILAGAELQDIFDGAASTFTAISSMNSPRSAHTATLLPNGKVLIVGGVFGFSLNTAEIFDPATGIFTYTGSMPVVRSSHTATLLPNGKVLVAGGYNDAASVKTALLYDPGYGTFTATGDMITARKTHTATLLANGKVLIAGGFNVSGSVAGAELYDPATGIFTATGSMATPRQSPTATLLRSGRVLIAGGASTVFLNSAELYDPAAGTFSPGGTMASPRLGHTATLLLDGRVLIAGGAGSASSAGSTELYDPTGSTVTSGTAIVARQLHTATLLPNGKVLIAGGYDTGALSSSELHDQVGVSSSSAAMTSARYSHTATLLPNGKVLLAGGTGTNAGSDMFDAGLGYADARRPVVSSLTSTLCQPANLALSGALFTGDSEGSSGSTGNSATNLPLLRLGPIENGPFLFVTTHVLTASAVFSNTLSNLPSGLYRAAILSNAIPSVEAIFEVGTTPSVGTYGSASIANLGSASVTPSSLPAGYNGAFYPLTATVSAGFTGTVNINGTSGVVSVVNAAPPGTYTITISSSTDCGAVTTSFTLDVIGLPASVTASGGTPQTGQTGLPFASPLQATVRDSVGHLINNATVTFTPPGAGASATFPGNGSVQTNSSGIASITATANATLGAYNATATVGGFTANFALTNAPDVPTNTVAAAATPTSVTVSWIGSAGATYEVLRVAAQAVSTTIGTSTNGFLTDIAASADTAYLYEVRAISPSSTPYGAPDLATTVIFTDPTITTGSTVVKASHFTKLRTAVNAVRALASLAAFPFTDATLTPGTTTIKAVHLTDLRTALDAARSSLSLPAIAYTHPAVTSGATITAADVNDLRAGVQ